MDCIIAENEEENEVEIRESCNADDLKKEEFKKSMKEKIKEGFIPIIIQNPTLNQELYYANPKVKFKVIVEKFNKKNPGKNWFFLFKGNIIDLEKTLEELKMKPLSKILVHENIMDI